MYFLMQGYIIAPKVFSICVFHLSNYIVVSSQGVSMAFLLHASFEIVLKWFNYKVMDRKNGHIVYTVLLPQIKYLFPKNQVALI